MNSLWLKALLAVSLAFNVAVVADHLLHEPPPPREMKMPEAAEQHLTRRMSGQDAAILRAAFEANRTEFRQREEETQSARDELRAALDSSPYDSTKVGKGLNGFRLARSAMEELIQRCVLDAAGKLSAKGRIALLPPRDAGPPSPHDDRDHPPPGP